MASRRVLAALVLMLLSLLPTLANPAAAVTLTLFERNTSFSGASQPLVYIGQSLGQSFTATANYTLARVVLYVQDRGTDDSLTASIVRDAGGVPGSSPTDVLTQGSNNTPSTAGWANFDLQPHAPIVQGQRYWIVANNSALNSNNGYFWYDQKSDIYAGGNPAYNQGAGWLTFTTEDFTFQNYGYYDGRIRVAIQGDRSQATIGAPVQYRVYFNNTGNAAAAKVWVNVSLPNNLTYVSDSASSVGGIALATTQWLFLNVTPGAHSFLLNVNLAGGLGGATLTTSVTSKFVGALGTVLDGGAASANLVVRGPSLSPTLTAVPGQIRRSRGFSLRGYFNNSGNDATGLAWFNLTLPAFMAYGRDDVNASATIVARGSGPGSLNLTLSNVSVGTHNFTVDLLPSGDPPVGTTFASLLTLEYRSSAGTPFPRASASALAVLVGPRVTLASSIDRVFATPGDVVVGKLDYGNGGAWATPAANMSINATLGPYVTFLNASSGATWDAANRTLVWYFPSLGVGQSGSLWFNSTVRWPVGDLTALDYRAVAAFRDDQGTPMPAVFSNRTTSVRVPVLSLVSAISRSSLEAQDPLTYTVQFNNSGTGTTGTAWVNITLGAGLSFEGFALKGVAGSLQAFSASSGALFFTLGGLVPGDHTLLIQLGAVGRLPDGTQLTVTSTATYGDLNGNVGATLQGALHRATVKAPALEAALGSSATSALPGQRVTLHVTVQNPGAATARDYWANLTLDPSLQVVGGNAPAQPEVQGPRYAYHLKDLTPGKTLAFDLVLEVASNATAGRSMFIILAVDYGDAQGTHLASVRPPGVPLTVLQGPARGYDPATLAPPLGIIAAIGLALFLVVRYVREPEIEEVLLVHKEGLLMAQVSRSETHGKDRDILASSLVAVKDFIREAFHEETSKELDRMDLGDYKLLIRRGRGAFLVVALQGSPTRRTQARVRETLGAIESLLGPKLEEWNGDTEEVMGVIPVLENLLHRGRPPSRDQPPPPPPIAQFPPQ